MNCKALINDTNDVFVQFLKMEKDNDDTTNDNNDSSNSGRRKKNKVNIIFNGILIPSLVICRILWITLVTQPEDKQTASLNAIWNEFTLPSIKCSIILVLIQIQFDILRMMGIKLGHKMMNQFLLIGNPYYRQPQQQNGDGSQTMIGVISFSFWLFHLIVIATF